MKTVAVCNQKGGVGKSTMAYHLANTLARSGKRVLVVDSDPQGNITLAMTKEPLGEDSLGLAHVLSESTNVPLADVVVPTVFEGVDLIPTTGDALNIVRNELVVAGAAREFRLRSALSSVADIGRWDVCLVDCPPSLDQLTINALTAADSTVVVTHARLWSAQGLAKLLTNVELIRQAYNPILRVEGILANQVEAQTSAAKHWLKEVTLFAKESGVKMLYPLVPKRVGIADAVERSEPITDSTVKVIFEALARSLMQGGDK